MQKHRGFVRAVRIFKIGKINYAPEGLGYYLSGS